MECCEDFYIHNFKLKPCNKFEMSVFTEGTSIYEVIRIKQGIPLFLEDHLNRLFNSADISNLSINESYCDLETLIEELIKKNKVKEGKIKLIIRFEKEKGSSEKDLLIYFTPHYFPTKDKYRCGVSIGICQAIRINPTAKILNTEARISANNTIAKRKLFEVLLQNTDGFVTEGSRSNIFFIKNNKVLTPPKKDVLNGITKMNIIKICKLNNIEISEKEIHYSEIQAMDSLFLSGTSLGALAVKNMGKLKFNTNNNILIQIMKLYEESLEDYISSKI